MTTRDFGHLGPADLDLLLDGSLDPARALHLETCPECREWVERDGAFFGQFRSLQQPVPSPSFASLILQRLSQLQPAFAELGRHLSAEEIDAWLSGVLSPARRWHLTDCQECRTLAETERELVARLAALPLLSPAPAFGDRVLSGVTMAPAHGWESVRRRVFASRKSMALAASATVVLFGSMAASVSWTLGHREVLAEVGSWAGGQLAQWLWNGARGMAAELMEQPWYSALSRLFAAPGRIAVTAALAATAYGGGIFALRRLITTPRVQAIRAAL